MRIFNRIIQDSKAPNTFDLWINKGRLKYFNGGWKDLGGSEQVSWNDIQGKPNLSAVATSGSYNDLSDKPTIPPAYSLPIANANTLGGVKSATTGTTSGRDYNVQINADGTMKVNVPWVNLNTTYAKATDTTLGLVMIGYTENGKNYPVELDGYGKMYVNVPWANTTYSVATQSANGLMSSSDKTKLDNLIEIPTGGTTGQVLKKTADGVAWQNDNNTFPQASPIDGTETIAIVQQGENRQLNLKTLIESVESSISSDFTNLSKGGGGSYTLEEALDLVNPINRKLGQVITFLDSNTNSWVSYQFKGDSIEDWSDSSMWENVLTGTGTSGEYADKFDAVHGDNVEETKVHVDLVYADRATKDALGNTIHDTYVTKEGLTNAIIEEVKKQLAALG